MKDILKKLEATFDTTTHGYSARKLSAFVGVLVCIIMSFRFGNESNLLEMLQTWFLFVTACLGLVTLGKYSNGKKEDANG